MHISKKYKNLIVFGILMTVILRGGSSIDIPANASITVPSGGYLCATTITVSGTLTYYNTADVCVTPSGSGAISNITSYCYDLKTSSWYSLFSLQNDGVSSSIYNKIVKSFTSYTDCS